MVDDKPDEARTEGTEPTGRRRALELVVLAGSAAFGVVVAAPAARLAMADAGGAASASRWLPVARLADLPIGRPVRAAVKGDARDAFTLTRGEELGAVWLVRDGETVRALSTTCPHLGCAIDVADASKPDAGFACPCHTSRFSADGAVTSGPSPRAMDRLDTRLVDGHVEVDFKRFRQGVTGREPVGA
ncbi:MAG TPA: Rieske (2Fe-2S) protein [Byssovorax sp.]|jgi:cytochrome b6-f complex iron-sulfur subunit/menaquinol-cytochrome c reductase iron-sulfur subunit